MNVYVESNFVLEQALEQEQSDSCDKLIGFGATGSINIVIPAFALAEPHITLKRYGRARSRLIDDLEKQIKDLSRSKPYREVSGTLRELRALFTASGQADRARLQSAMNEILGTAQVIPLSADVLRDAQGVQLTFDMSFQDSIMLASVVWHLRETAPAQSCFLNRNTKDFADPIIREMLFGFGCKFFGRFDHALRYVEAHLRDQS